MNGIDVLPMLLLLLSGLPIAVALAGFLFVECAGRAAMVAPVTGFARPLVLTAPARTEVRLFPAMASAKVGARRAIRSAAPGRRMPAAADAMFATAT